MSVVDVARLVIPWKRSIVKVFFKIVNLCGPPS